MISRKILFIITGLSAGGAEAMLLKLLSRLDRRYFAPEVISLTQIDTLASRYAEAGIPVQFFGMERGRLQPTEMVKVAVAIRRKRPDLVQTWMYHADLIGGIGSRLAGLQPLIWNVRNSSLDPAGSKRSTVLVAKACARLSHVLPHKIVCCSKAAAAIHVKMGYEPSRMVFIPNGFDLSAFRPDAQARQLFRSTYAVPAESVIIGYVARFDAQKDHRGFLQAASRLSAVCPNAVFVLCGDGMTDDNPDLCRWIEEYRLEKVVHLLGRRHDIPAVTAAFDIATSASAYGEAFSNAIGEAMACAVPCVVTDVGDSATIVGETGKVVAPRDPQALAAGWQELIAIGRTGRAELGQLARQRIDDEFSIDKIVAQYEDLYAEVLEGSS